MAETDKIGKGLNHFSSQFLEKFDPRKELSRVNSKVEDEEEEGEIELSLGLSLNGRFGVDPKGKNLIRSCSVSDFNLNPDGEIETTRIKPVEYTHLTRTTSLPTEAEEEWRVRKEMQMVRRMETKRKRSEKQRTVRGIPVPWVKGCSMGHEFESNPELGNSGGSGPPPLARSGSSVISRVDSKRDQGLVKTPESTEHSEQNLTAVSTETKTSAKANEDVTEKCKPKPSGPTRATSELVRNLLADMPCVSTKGNGPGGKRIEGFLYGYKKGEEVRIVCVCHGSFLTPAEFVRHAGGGDVEHPLKHIVVNPSPFL